MVQALDHVEAVDVMVPDAIEPNSGKTMRSMSFPRKRLLAAICSVCVGSASAAQLDFYAGYQAEQSSNILLVHTNPQSEVIQSVSTGLSYLENTPTLNARANLGVAFRDYRNDVLADDTETTLDLLGEAYAVPRILSWVLADTYRAVSMNPLLADTPVNREKTNLLLTGPNYRMYPTGVDTVTLEARYGNFWTETTDVDNERYAAAARWAHRLSPITTLQLNHETLRVAFDRESLNADYDRYDTFLRFSYMSITEVTLDAGTTRLDRHSYDEVVTGALYRAEIARQFSSVSRATLSWERDFSDTALDLAPAGATSELADPAGGTGVSSTDVVRRNRASAFFSYRGGIFPWSARAFKRESDYLVELTDTTERGWVFDVEHALSNHARLQASYARSTTEFTVLGREDEDLHWGVGATYLLNRNLELRADYRRNERESTSPGFSFEENRMLVSIFYRSRPTQAW